MAKRLVGSAYIERLQCCCSSIATRQLRFYDAPWGVIDWSFIV